jgi:hypothetical protein
MRCEQNVQVLIDAAALGQTPEDSVAEHMQHCWHCQARFQRDQQLFSAIDGALQTRLSEVPRSGFLGRVHARLAEESATNSGVKPSWGAAAVLVLAVLASTRLWMTSRQTIVAVTPAVSTASVKQTSSPTGALDGNRRIADVRPQKFINQRSATGNAAPREPEVLVPPDEQKAFAQFVSRVAGQDAMAAAVVSQAPDKTIARSTELPQASSVDIADLLDRTEQDDWRDRTGDSE